MMPLASGDGRRMAGAPVRTPEARMACVLAARYACNTCADWRLRDPPPIANPSCHADSKARRSPGSPCTTRAPRLECATSPLPPEGSVMRVIHHPRFFTAS